MNSSEIRNWKAELQKRLLGLGIGGLSRVAHLMGKPVEQISKIIWRNENLRVTTLAELYEAMEKAEDELPKPSAEVSFDYRDPDAFVAFIADYKQRYEELYGRGAMTALLKESGLGSNQFYGIVSQGAAGRANLRIERVVQIIDAAMRILPPTQVEKPEYDCEVEGDEVKKMSIKVGGCEITISAGDGNDSSRVRQAS